METAGELQAADDDTAHKEGETAQTPGRDTGLRWGITLLGSGNITQ